MYFLIGLFLGWLLGLATPPFYKWIVQVVTKKGGSSAAVLLIFLLPLQSCGHFPDGTSVWAEWTWLVPLIPFVGAVIFGVKAYRKSKSGSEQQQPGGGYVSYRENVPIYKIGQFWFSMILLAAAVAIIIAQNASK